MKRKALITCGLSALMMLGVIGCGNNNQKSDTKENKIIVVSREDGSGTRGAFIELFGIEQKNASGKKVDYIHSLLVITDTVKKTMYEFFHNDTPLI